MDQEELQLWADYLLHNAARGMELRTGILKAEAVIWLENDFKRYKGALRKGSASVSKTEGEGSIPSAPERRLIE